MSRREQIFDALKTALDAMSVANGQHFEYPHDVQEITFEAPELGRWPAVILGTDDESKTGLTESTTGSTIDFLCAIHTGKRSDTGTLSAERVLTRHAEDVEEVVMADTSLGGLVTNMEVTEVQRWFEPEEGADAFVVQVRITVQFRHDVDDPSTYSGL